MIEQLHNDPKTIPKPPRDEMIRMLYESHVSLQKDYAKEFKSLWVTNALDGSEDYLVSERVYKLARARMIDFRNQLMKTASSKNLKQLLKMVTPLKGVKRKDANGPAAPVDKGDELFDCEREEIETETIDEDISTSDKQDETPQATSQAAANDAKPLNDAKFIDEMGQLLLTLTTSTRISSSIRGIQRHYTQARVKEQIHLAKSTNKQARIEGESPNNDNNKVSEIIDDIRNIFCLIKNG